MGVNSNLRQQRDRFVAFSFAAADLLIETGAGNRITYASGAAQRLLGVDAQALVGRPVVEIFSVGDHSMVTSLVLAGAARGRFGPVMVKLAHKGGRPLRAILNGCRLPGRPDDLYLTLNAASAMHATEALANRRDAETGLLDGDSFARVTAESIKMAQAVGQEVKVTLIDLVGFAEMQAQAGQDPTDQFLREVGAFLRSHAVGDASARLSPDKYGLLHDARLDTSDLEEQIANLGQAASPESPPLAVRHATLDAQDETDDAAVARALVYTVNRFVGGGSDSFDITSMAGAVRGMIDETLNKVRVFKSTVAQREMSLRFQPIVDLRSRKPHHFEVLVRFDGDKSPYEMIKFAESMHLVHEMDLAICESVIQWLSRGDGAGGAMVAVNLSAQSLQNDIFVSALLDLVRRNSRYANRLAFEITESSELSDIEGTNRVLQELRELGHEICLDDFGAGFASFQYLHGLHVDWVKFDGRYIRSVLEVPRDRVLLKAMANLCRELQIRTVGEQVETESQAGMLTDLGVEYAQGWLFGKPALEPRLGVPEPVRPVNARRQGSRETWG
ncbi:EAL domain-containing protein (putative c-di-GMP-specific phosphodiesterase class I)/GGDEF domain-containing protein [Constrictibacter sp. MBR-5]